MKNSTDRKTSGRGMGFVTVALVFVLLVAGFPASAGAQAVPQRNNVHATAAAFGHVINATVKADGRLYTREYDPEFQVWGDFYRHGAANWANVDVAIDNAGNAILVATKQNGSLWTRTSPTTDVWSSWTLHGSPNWSATAAPSVSLTSNGDDAQTSNAVISALKADGRLYVREWSYASFSWGDFQRLGAGGWANADVVITQGSANRQIWVVGAKTDGRLYTVRKTLGGAWGDWTRHGAATWSAATPPSITAASATLVAYSAVKDDGRLYVRTFQEGAWGGYLRQGAASWASASVSVDGNGLLVLLAAKTSGALYLRLGPQGIFGDFAQLGAPTWSNEQPSVASTRDKLEILVVKANGAMYSRSWTAQNGFAAWKSHGFASWAA